MRKMMSTWLLIASAAISLKAHSTSFSQPRSAPVSGEESLFVLEPYVSYERGYLTQKGIPEIATMGPAFGARIGGRYWGIGFGLDYLNGSESASQSGQKSDFKPTELGFFLNYKILTDYRIYGSYLFSAKAKVQPRDNPSDFSGTGYKLGVGWGAFSFLDVNLELYNRVYSKYGGSNLANSLLSSTVGLCLSFPIL